MFFFIRHEQGKCFGRCFPQLAGSHYRLVLRVMRQPSRSSLTFPLDLLHLRLVDPSTYAAQHAAAPVVVIAEVGLAHGLPASSIADIVVLRLCHACLVRSVAAS